MNDEDLLNYYWKYFELHSKQRIQMINFYITVTVVLYGGLFALIQLDSRLPIAEFFITVFIMLVSGCFLRLDQRTSTLIHGCEECIKELEKSLSEEKQLIHKSESLLESSKSYSSTFSILAICVIASAVVYIILRTIEIIGVCFQ
jgi:hypothetical protein